MSCGRVALERAGAPVSRYYACEIDKYAITVSKKNWPDIIQLGSVTELSDWWIENVLPPIDLVIGGSPCQGFSRDGKKLNFADPRSVLFFQFVRILRAVMRRNPNAKFKLENVHMAGWCRDIISQYLGVQPVRINSNLVSAQNRIRYYWTNIWDVPQPEDRGIYLKDIIEPDAWPFTFTIARTEEAKVIRREMSKKLGKDFSPRSLKDFVVRTDGKANCITASFNEKGAMLMKNTGKHPGVLVGHMQVKAYEWRRQTPVEWERLQGLPDNYTLAPGVSKTQRYKMLGNGWQVDTIAHIFKPLSD
jgi:DNA (cytosine-5)-methyltransferase 3A